MFPPPPTPLSPSSKSDEVKRVIFCQKTTKKKKHQISGSEKYYLSGVSAQKIKKEHNKNKNPKLRKEQDNDNRKTER